MKQKTIIAIVGLSGSGKDTVSKIMYINYNIPSIVSYTTRKIRDGEINGVEHWFVNKENVPPKSHMFAHTVYGGYDYWTLTSDILMNLDNHPAISYVVDELGVEFLRKKMSDDSRFKDVDLKTVYVTANYEKRLERGVSKERIERDFNRLSIDTDFEIDNSYTLYSLNNQINSVIKQIIK